MRSTFFGLVFTLEKYFYRAAVMTNSRGPVHRRCDLTQCQLGLSTAFGKLLVHFFLFHWQMWEVLQLYWIEWVAQEINGRTTSFSFWCWAQKALVLILGPKCIFLFRFRERPLSLEKGWPLSSSDKTDVTVFGQVGGFKGGDGIQLKC